MSDPKQEDPGADFDAISAAAELTEALESDDGDGTQQPTSDDYTRMLESEIEALNAVIESRDAALAKAEARADAAQNEIEKSKARLAAEAERETERKVRKVLISMLEILDDLDRALAAAVEAGAKDAVVDGVQLVRKSFQQHLAAYGVRHHPALGEPFDPNLHEGISVLPAPTPDDAGRVLAVISEGYDIGDEVLRPAKVAVAKG